ncbi:unnamed protein product [Amoebophrya sp. A120]|nr:unnamed protein product [Amoebophrya sp. A120]|eukprot:GSA120T00012357001.1
MTSLQGTAKISIRSVVAAIITSFHCSLSWSSYLQVGQELRVSFARAAATRANAQDETSSSSATTHAINVAEQERTVSAATSSSQIQQENKYLDTTSDTNAVPQHLSNNEGRKARSTPVGEDFLVASDGSIGTSFTAKESFRRRNDGNNQNLQLRESETRKTTKRILEPTPEFYGQHPPKSPDGLGEFLLPGGVQRFSLSSDDKVFRSSGVQTTTSSSGAVALEEAATASTSKSSPTSAGPGANPNMLSKMNNLVGRSSSSKNPGQHPPRLLRRMSDDPVQLSLGVDDFGEKVDTGNVLEAQKMASSSDSTIKNDVNKDPAPGPTQKHSPILTADVVDSRSWNYKQHASAFSSPSDDFYFGGTNLGEQARSSGGEESGLSWSSQRDVHVVVDPLSDEYVKNGDANKMNSYAGKKSQDSTILSTTSSSDTTALPASPEETAATSTDGKEMKQKQASSGPGEISGPHKGNTGRTGGTTASKAKAEIDNKRSFSAIFSTVFSNVLSYFFAEESSSDGAITGAGSLVRQVLEGTGLERDPHQTLPSSDLEYTLRKRLNTQDLAVLLLLVTFYWSSLFLGMQLVYRLSKNDSSVKYYNNARGVYSITDKSSEEHDEDLNFLGEADEKSRPLKTAPSTSTFSKNKSRKEEEEVAAAVAVSSESKTMCETGQGAGAVLAEEALLQRKDSDSSLPQPSPSQHPAPSASRRFFPRDENTTTPPEPPAAPTAQDSPTTSTIGPPEERSHFMNLISGNSTIFTSTSGGALFTKLMSFLLLCYTCCARFLRSVKTKLCSPGLCSLFYIAVPQTNCQELLFCDTEFDWDAFQKSFFSPPAEVKLRIRGWKNSVLYDQQMGGSQQQSRNASSHVRGGSSTPATTRGLFGGGAGGVTSAAPGGRNSPTTTANTTNEVAPPPAGNTSASMASLNNIASSFFQAIVPLPTSIFSSGSVTVNASSPPGRTNGNDYTSSSTTTTTTAVGRDAGVGTSNTVPAIRGTMLNTTTGGGGSNQTNDTNRTISYSQEVEPHQITASNTTTATATGSTSTTAFRSGRASHLSPPPSRPATSPSRALDSNTVILNPSPTAQQASSRSRSSGGRGRARGGGRAGNNNSSATTRNSTSSSSGVPGVGNNAGTTAPGHRGPSTASIANGNATASSAGTPGPSPSVTKKLTPAFDIVLDLKDFIVAAEEAESSGELHGAGNLLEQAPGGRGHRETSLIRDEDHCTSPAVQERVARAERDQQLLIAAYLTDNFSKSSYATSQQSFLLPKHLRTTMKSSTFTKHGLYYDREDDTNALYNCGTSKCKSEQSGCSGYKNNPASAWSAGSCASWICSFFPTVGTDDLNVLQITKQISWEKKEFQKLQKKLKNFLETELSFPCHVVSTVSEKYNYHASKSSAMSSSSTTSSINSFLNLKPSTNIFDRNPRAVATAFRNNLNLVELQFTEKQVLHVQKNKPLGNFLRNQTTAILFAASFVFLWFYLLYVHVYTNLFRVTRKFKVKVKAEDYWHTLTPDLRRIFQQVPRVAAPGLATTRPTAGGGAGVGGGSAGR